MYFLQLRLLAGEKFVRLLVLGHGLGDNIIGKGDAGALIESNRIEVIAKVLLVEAAESWYRLLNSQYYYKMILVRTVMWELVLTYLGQHQPCMKKQARSEKNLKDRENIFEQL